MVSELRSAPAFHSAVVMVSYRSARPQWSASRGVGHGAAPGLLKLLLAGLTNKLSVGLGGAFYQGPAITPLVDAGHPDISREATNQVSRTS
jgi:hypothetical protein